MKKYNTPEIKLDVFETEEIALFATSGELNDENLSKSVLDFGDL